MSFWERIFGPTPTIDEFLADARDTELLEKINSRIGTRLSLATREKLRNAIISRYQARIAELEAEAKTGGDDMRNDDSYKAGGTQ